MCCLISVAAMYGECVCMASVLSELELAAGGGAKVERVATCAGGALDDLGLAHGLGSFRSASGFGWLSFCCPDTSKSRLEEGSRRGRYPPIYAGLTT